MLTTCDNPKQAAALAKVLVEERLAACVSMVPGVQSVYRWQGQVEQATETLLVIKSTAKCLAELESRIHQLHSYETPELLVIEVASASQKYLSWLIQAVEPPNRAESA